MPEAPVIQPNASPGGASLAPDAGAPGATINPTEARVQQQAAAAVAAQQASAAYAKRERDVREYTDALVEYHDLPDEFRSTEAPEMTMVNRRGTEIASLRSPRGADLAANARDAETQQFADWEQDQLFEGDKLHRARDYLYYKKAEADAGLTRYFSGRAGDYEKDLIDVQRAYNEARNEGRDFVWEGDVADPEQLAKAYSTNMMNLGADRDTKQMLYENYVSSPLNLGRVGVLTDPNSAASRQLLEAEYQKYLEFRDTPLTLENKVYMPQVSIARINADAANSAARSAYNTAQSAYVQNQVALMKDMGFTSADELNRAVSDYKAYQASQPTFTDQVRAAERADWIAYQNRSASQQTNPVLRDYAAATEREAEYNLLGQPVGIARVPTLTNAEKYAVLNEMSPGQYLYNPLTDQISKKQQVNTSDYLTTKWYNDFVNSAPVSAIRETFGIDNWNKQIEEIKEEAGIVEGDTTGKGLAYGFIEPFLNLGLNLGPIALQKGNEIEHTFRNSEEFLTMPASQFLGNVGAKIYDTYLEFEKDPHRVTGNIAGSLLLGYLSGAAGIGGVIKVGSAGKTSLVRGAQSDIVGTLAKDAGLDAGLAKTAYYAGGDLVEAARKIDLNPVEAGTLRTNQLSMFQGIDTPPIERALARADTTLYGTSTNPIYDFNFRGSRDIDAGVPPQNFDTLVSDVMPIIPAERKPQLSPGEGVRGITALTPEGSARAHLLDLHPTDPATPAGRYLGVYDDLSGNSQPSLYTYPRTPESIAEYKRIRITGEPQGSIYVEPAWAAVGRKFGAVYNPRNEYSQLLTDTTIRNPRTIQYQTKIDLDSYARGFVEEGPETTRRITPRTATYRVAAAVGDVGNLINRARSARTPGDVSKKINLIPELGDTHRMKDALDLLGLGYEYSQAKVLGNVRNPVSRSMLQRRIGKDVDRLLEDPYFVSMARTGALQRYSELSPGFRDWLTERGVLKAKQTGTVQEGTAYLSGAVNPKSIVSYAPPSRQKTSGGNVPVIVGVGSASLAPKGSYVPSASPKIRSSPSITGKGGGVEIYRVPNPATYQPPKTPPYEPPIPPYQPPKTPKTPPYEPPIPPYQPPKTPKTPIPPYQPPKTPKTPPYEPPIPPYQPPKTPKTPIPPRRRRRTDNPNDPLGGFRRIRVENIEHLSILDPLEALGIGSMTNRSRKKAQPKTTYYEYGGVFHAELPGADYLGLVMPKQRSKSRKQASKKRGRK